MSILKSHLIVPPSVTLSSYFPARTKSTGEFDWDVAKGVVTRNLYRKVVSSKIAKLEIDENGEKQRRHFISYIVCILNRDHRQLMDITNSKLNFVFSRDSKHFSIK